MKQKMKHRNGLIAMLVIVIVSTFACKPDPLEYARPENLAGTIYQQLESLGTFNYYLQSLDQTEYKEPLLKGGSWTVFAPTDEAFESFMQEEGFASFDAIPQERILDMIKYSIVTDGYNTTTLTYFKNRFYLGQSFRRRTQYEAPNRVYNSDSLQHINDWEPGEYLVRYGNGRQKTLSYFLDSYMDNWGITYPDYEFMFPGETFNAGDMKVYDANVSQQNIVAENGMIYALDKVLEPEKNIYENLTSAEYGGKYTLFKKIIERFATITETNGLFDINPETGEEEQLYNFSFQTNPLREDYIPFNPLDENKQANIDATLANSWGILVPTNDALTSYLDNSLLGQFYDSYDDMPLPVLSQFLSPFFLVEFWDIIPSRYGLTFDSGLKLVDYKAEDIVDKKYCSNGFFVGVNKVYTNSSFGTILGPLLLDSEYSIMLKAVQDLGIDSALESKAVRFSILGVRNDQFIDVADPNSPTRRITVDSISVDDIVYMTVTGDSGNGNRTYPDPTATTPNSADIAYVTKTINDIVLNQIIFEDVDFSGNNYYQTQSGEFVNTFNGNSAAGGEDIQANESVQIEGVQETENGNFYEMSGIINRPTGFAYATLTSMSDTFSSFIQVLESADALIPILGIDDKLVNFLNPQRTFTLFAPNNDAVAQAITDGVIVDPFNLPTDALALAEAKRDLLIFAQKHFVQQAMATDGKTSGVFSTLYSTRIVDFAPVYEQVSIVNTTSSITVTNDDTGDSATTGSVTNLFSKRVAIHEIDNYLK